jgi:hypothetical protein
LDSLAGCSTQLSVDHGSPLTVDLEQLRAAVRGENAVLSDSLRVEIVSLKADFASFKSVFLGWMSDGFCSSRRSSSSILQASGCVLGFSRDL